MQVTLDHIALNVSDIDAAVEFYEKVLCLDIERLEKFEKGSALFPSARLNDDTVIDLFPPAMRQTAEAKNIQGKTGFSHFCLTMTEHEWKELILRLKENNVEIIRFDDNNWGAKGIGISIYFHDPDGNEIEARYYRDE